MTNSVEADEIGLYYGPRDKVTDNASAHGQELANQSGEPVITRLDCFETGEVIQGTAYPQKGGKTGNHWGFSDVSNERWAKIFGKKDIPLTPTPTLSPPPKA